MHEKMRSKSVWSNAVLRCLRSPPYFAGMCLLCWLAYCIVRSTSFTTNFHNVFRTVNSTYDEDDFVASHWPHSPPGPKALQFPSAAISIVINNAATVSRRSISPQNYTFTVDSSTTTAYQPSSTVAPFELFSTSSPSNITSSSEVPSTTGFAASSSSTTAVLLHSATGPPIELSERQHRMRTTFDFIINEPDLCRNDDENRLYLIAYVHTSPANFARRAAIRQSWANRTYARQLGLKVFFLMGCPSKLGNGAPAESVDSSCPLLVRGRKQSGLMKRLGQESQKYHDLVMADFVDSYWNLTLKNLAGLRWIQQHCVNERSLHHHSPPPYVLKADDDVFVDTFRLVRYLRSVDIFYGESRNLTSNDENTVDNNVDVSATEPSLTSRIQQKLALLLPKKLPPPPVSSDDDGLFRPLFDSTSAAIALQSISIANNLKLTGVEANAPHQQQSPPTRRTFFGYTYLKSRPIRTEHHKWFVTSQEYAGHVYPEYCAGAAYVHTIDVVKPLLAAAAKRKYYLSIDDVLITGVLRVEIGARVQSWNELYRFMPKIPNCQFFADDPVKAKSTTTTSASQHVSTAQTKAVTPVRTLGQCYISRRYVFVHLMKEALAMVEIWSKVLQRERPSNSFVP